MKIVVITSRFPYPIEKGDKLRAFHHIKALAENHEVFLVSISHRDILQKELDILNSYCVDVKVFKMSKLKLYYNLLSAFLKGLPMMIGYFLDVSIKAKIHNYILETNPDHIFAQLIRTSEYVRSLPFTKTLDYMDVFSVGMKQRANAVFWPVSALYSYESKLLSRYEQLIYPEFDHHSIISTQDRDRLKVTYNKNILVLPNGVDSQFFQATYQKPNYDIVFVGNMGYLPNVEAAEYLVKNLLPKLTQAFPRIKILIAGARPSSRVKQLANHHVTISGWVEDIRSAYADGKIFVAPIFSGMGQQNKILEAMSMSKPCVTTVMVNNAIGATSGKELLVADDEKQTVECILQLLQDDQKRKLMGQSARKFVLNNYSWSHQNGKLENLLQKKSILQSIN